MLTLFDMRDPSYDTIPFDVCKTDFKILLEQLKSLLLALAFDFQFDLPVDTFPQCSLKERCISHDLLSLLVQDHAPHKYLLCEETPRIRYQIPIHHLKVHG